MMYKKRSYRTNISNIDFEQIHVTVRETDLFVLADRSYSDLVLNSVHRYRGYIESYIRYHPKFLTSLVPYEQDYFAPDIVRDMIAAGEKARVGPMASIAGAIAEHVGRDVLAAGSRNVIVENGGDIFLNSEQDVTVGVYAGESSLSCKVRLLVRKEKMPLGVCTSSGTVGHSLSFGKADAVSVLSKSTSLADAAATAIGNIVSSRDDIYRAFEWGFRISGVLGILIIVDEQLAAQGMIELI
jgi:ApbE superfamily uncharacterized protein (UPF0280 family)